ncbi:MAG: iron-containing alcohol dehydrogenase [Clostridiales bacterium]|nr:iron-containing alcohol dehydrogenase [Clostridiales bacterium]
MIDFSFQNPTRIHFGRNALEQLPKEVERYGKRVLLVYGGGSIKRTGVYDAVMQKLGNVNAQVWELAGVQPNPRLSPVREGIEVCRREQIQLVLAVGGGSAIDTAKAIVNGACYEGDVWELYEGKGTNETALPLGVVLTIPAAGSEMSRSSVITREEDLCKRGRNAFTNFPTFSILNPEYSFTLPPYQTACGIVDIMAHMMERYFTMVENVELTDRLIEGALVTVINNAPIVMAKPDDYDARAEITWAGALAHNTLLDTGRVGDWASHKLEHELSALYDIAHGAGLAVMFPAWMKYVLPRGGARKLAQFARRVFAVGEAFATDEEAANEGILRLEAFYRSLGLPTTLGEMGIDGSRIPEMAARAVAMMGGRLGGFVPLDAPMAEEVYRLAL